MKNEKDKKIISKFSLNKAFGGLVLFFSLIISFTTCYFAAPTIFGGRDQGAIATAAINLAKYKSFTFSTPVSRDLFQKYGSGKALNFPGFDYTKDGKLITRFPKAYIVYLAGLYSLLDLKGIQYANLIPLFLFFILFWLTLRQFFEEKISFFGFLLAATFFPFLWFAKYTLTEIFMLFLVWGGIYFLIVLRRGLTSTAVEVKPLRLYISLAFFGLSALTRIEGLAFFLLAVIYIYILNRKNLARLTSRQKTIVAFACLTLLVLFAIFNYHDFTDSAKNIIKAFLPGSTKESAPSIGLYSQLVILFLNYNLLPYLILGIAGIALFFQKMKLRELTHEESLNSSAERNPPKQNLAFILRTYVRGVLRRWIKERFLKPEFAIFFILFPSFFYLVSPLVSLDDPWLFRRFTFSVFPALIFYSIYFLNQYNNKKTLIYAIFITLIASNLIITSQYLTYSENKNLLPQVENLSKKFNDDDLILIDCLATGSGWSLISEPLNTLYGKQAVYFFNADDLKYISHEKYQSIFLIAPPASNASRSDAGRLDGDQSWYDSLDKELVDTVEIRNNFLEESSGFFSLSQNVEMTTTNGIWKIR